MLKMLGVIAMAGCLLTGSLMAEEGDANAQKAKMAELKTEMSAINKKLSPIKAKLSKDESLADLKKAADEARSAYEAAVMEKISQDPEGGALAKEYSALAAEMKELQHKAKPEKKPKAKKEAAAEE